MTGYLFLKLAHVLFFVYWLGGDLGTYYASRFVIDSKLSPPQRSTAFRIMMGVDMGPRICMPFMLVTGVHLASIQGWLLIAPALLALLWAFTLAWVALVIAVHHFSGHSSGTSLGVFDYWLRVAVIIVVGAGAFASFFSASMIAAPWVAAKLLIFSGTVLCGLLIRLRLKPFAAAFNKILTQGPDVDTDRVIAQSLIGCRRFVNLIWVGLLLCAALGLHLL